MLDEMEEQYKTNLSIKRTRLAITQTDMAAKRTLLSYISTGCVLFSLALAYLKLIDSTIDALTIILFGVAIIFIGFGVIDYVLVQKSVKSVMKDCELHERIIKSKEDSQNLKD